ncbi:hypothetical protein [Acetobacterium wieringae]|uniref:hypothetical protein n=1 Tax=Acetobacterium wieringae TaxID=52694 RepID=UPI0031585765
MSITIVVPDTPPSNNKFMGRENRWNYQKYKKEWAMLMRSGMVAIPKRPMLKAKVHIHYTFPTKIRRDPDNYSGKMILDPLVQYGVISDDSFDRIDLVLSAEYKKGVKETRVTISEVRHRANDKEPTKDPQQEVLQE